jgi:exodeoxyribonuclease VII small subunit
VTEEPGGLHGQHDLTELTYGEALEELEELLDELEGADIDVDRLAERVARGAELVRFCRTRLDVVSKDVDQVVTDLISTDDLAAQPSADHPAEDDGQ